MKRHKLLLVLIVLSVTVSGALLYTSLNISLNLQNAFEQTAYENNGYSNVYITQNSMKSQKGESFLNYSTLNKKVSDVSSHVIGEILTYGVIQNAIDSYKFKIHCINTDDVELLTGISISNADAFTGKTVIISKQTAEKYGFVVGDHISLLVNGVKENLKIISIAENRGIFSANAETMTLIIPLKTAQNILGIDTDSVNRIHIFNAKNYSTEKVYDYVHAKMPDLSVQKTADIDSSGINYKMFSTIFLLAAIVSSIMSLYIIYVCFKLLAYEYMQLLGILRSIGATFRQSSMVLCAEGLLYGLLSGVFASLTGSFFEWLSSGLISGMHVAYKYSLSSALITILFTSVIGLLGALLPVMRLRKLSIAYIFRRSYDQASKAKKTKAQTISGIILLILSVTIFRLFPLTPIIILSIIACIIAAIMLVPFLMDTVGKLLQIPLRALTGNIGRLAFMNLANNAIFLNCIKLFTVALAIIILVLTIGESVISATVKSYSIFNSDAVMYRDGMDDNFVNTIQSVDGVKSACATYQKWNIGIKGTKTTIQMLDSVDSNYSSYFNYPGMGEKEYQILLSGKKTIAISKVLASMLNYKTGDKITLVFGDNSTKQHEAEYTITAIYDVTMGSGKCALISKSNLLEDMHDVGNYDRLYIKTTKDVTQVIKTLNNKFSQKDLWLVSTAERTSSNVHTNRNVFTVIYLFVFLGCIVGAIGVLSNMAINFNKRKREMIIFYTVGMSKKGGVTCLTLEAVFIALFSYIFGCCLAFLLSSFLPSFYTALGFSPIKPALSLTACLWSAIGILLFSLLSAIANIIKSNRMSLVETIKICN